MAQSLYVGILLVVLSLIYLSLPVVFVGLVICYVLLVVVGNLIGTTTVGLRPVFRCLFVGPDDWHFGVRQDGSDCPMLFATVAEVAQKADAEPPDEIWLGPTDDFYLSQARRGPLGLFAGGKRVLVLGLAVMGSLSVKEFKVIVAHICAKEGRAVSLLCRCVFKGAFTLRAATSALARAGGRLNYNNPFFWVVLGYKKLYGMLSAAFIRSIIIRGDHVASSLYGADVFLSALRKLCTNGALFNKTMYGNLLRQLKEKKAFINMYKAFRDYLKTLTDKERRDYDDKVLNAPRARFADYPTFGERVAAVGDVPSAGENDRCPAMGMFDYPEEKEKELTDWLTATIQEAIKM